MNWKRVLPPTGGVAIIIAIIALMMKACYEEYYSGMVHVLAGEYYMGCDECQHFERPEHHVRLEGFWIDQYEVTNRQYCDFLNAALESGTIDIVDKIRSDGSTYQQVELEGNRFIYLYPYSTWTDIEYVGDVFQVRAGRDNYPVCVSWQGASAYCQTLSKRLPTEAEWEYAAKGGHLNRRSTGATDYYRYSGSDDADLVAWHQNNATATHEVGTLQPNELMIFDMSGNLREWVNDWYDSDYYSDSPVDDPQGPDESQYISELGLYAGKVMRGGSWRENLYRTDEDLAIETSIDRDRVRVTKRDFG